MNTSLLAVINNDLNLIELSQAGKQVLASTIMENFPLISFGNDVYKLLEINRLKKTIDRHDILLGLLQQTDQSNFYTHHKIINSLIFSDIALGKEVQENILKYVSKFDINNNEFNKVLKWLQEKQTWELNAIDTYELFIVGKDSEIYISTIDSESIIEDLFELNLPKGTYNTGPRKYPKITKFGLEILVNLFKGEKINDELKRVKKEVNYIQNAKIISVQPHFKPDNEQLKHKLYNGYNPDGRYNYLTTIEKKYIDFLVKLTHVVEVTHVTKLSGGNEVRDLVLEASDYIKKSKNYTAKIVKVEDMKPNAYNIQYYVKEVLEFLKGTDFATDDIWKDFLNSI